MHAVRTVTLLATTLVRADHVQSFHVHSAHVAGWEVSEREDQCVVQQQRYTDWHRVEGLSIISDGRLPYCSSKAGVNR
jgi:hypothetical protein